MIKRLRIKLVLLCALSLFILLVIMVSSINIINYRSLVKEADRTLSFLSEHQGRFPVFDGGDGKEKPDRLPPDMSPEAPYETRYFSVLFNASGEVITIETGRISSVSSDMAEEYARQVNDGGREKGFVDRFRFMTVERDGKELIIFLDCGRQMDVFWSFFGISSLVALGGFLLTLVVVIFLSNRLIRPIAESYEKQKRFITDAGHEINTPLTIIGANVDILQMEIGENESLSDISKQTKRLAALTDELVYLARMEEAENTQRLIDFPVSDVVSEAVHPFKALALAQGKTLECDIAPLLTMCGNAEAIERLVSILMDNALKYSPTGGSIRISLSGTTKSVTLTVANDTEATIDAHSLSGVFDRFYRADNSRNSERGGHGIGLSVAKAIVLSHGGKISATAPNSNTFMINAVFRTFGFSSFS